MRFGIIFLFLLGIASDDLMNVTKKQSNCQENFACTWLARKFETTQVVLHSFAYLSGSKAEPVFAEQLLQQIAERLRSVGFTVATTPFGYFNEFRVHVAGPSLAKAFVEV